MCREKLVIFKRLPFNWLSAALSKENVRVDADDPHD